MFRFDRPPSTYPSRIQFVDKTPPSTFDVAKKYDLEIIEAETNNNTDLRIPVVGTVYIFTDFENNAQFTRIDKTDDTWILGPTALFELTRNPELKIRRHSTYCYCMHPFVFYIECPGDRQLEMRMVKLLKWMGGRFVKEPNMYTTHMITTSTISEGYIYCSTFQVHILTPEWVEDCWSNRLQPFYDVTSSMKEFAVSPLLDLHIALDGFDSEGEDLFSTCARAKGAVVVHPEDVYCTHLVVSDRIMDRLNVTGIPRHIKYIVKEEWLILSLEFGRRVYEDGYHCFSAKGIRHSIYAEMDTTAKPGTRLTSDKKPPGVSKQDAADEKRKFAFMELVLKEQNYLHSLKLLADVQNAATDVTQNGGPIICQQTAKIIFGNIDKLIQIHEGFLEYLKDVQINWVNDIITTQGIIMMEKNILKQYRNYANNFNESKKMMETCLEKNKRFQKLLRDFMKNTNKEHPKDIFIRPIQRLCSLKLQVQEIDRHTREDNKDKEVLKKSISVIQEVLKSIDNSLQQYEKLLNVIDIGQRQIKNFPPDLITSHREFIVKFLVQELMIEKKYETQVGMRMAFFLFNDILVATNLLVKPQEALKDFHNYNSLKKKSFEYIAAFPLAMIYNVVQFESEDGDVKKQIFGLNIKNASSTIHCFHFLEENSITFENMLGMIAGQLADVDTVRSPQEFVISMPLASVGLTICPITKGPHTEPDFCDWFKTIFKVPTVSSSNKKTKRGLRRSHSCNDIIDLTSD